MKKPEIKPGTLVSVYPKNHYAGYVIHAALYCTGDIEPGPPHDAFDKDRHAATADIMYHTILTSGGTMVLPGDIYDVNIIQDPQNPP